MAQLPDNAFLMIDLDDNAQKVRWEEEDEFKLYGRMYDVARIKKQNGRTIAYCYHDLKEEKLITGFQELLEKEKHPAGKYNIPKFQHVDWIRPGASLQAAALFPAPGAVKYFDFAEKLFSNTRKVAKPPPDLVHIPDLSCFIPRRNRHFIYTEQKPAGYSRIKNAGDLVFIYPNTGYKTAPHHSRFSSVMRAQADPFQPGSSYLHTQLRKAICIRTVIYNQPDIPEFLYLPTFAGRSPPG